MYIPGFLPKEHNIKLLNKWQVKKLTKMTFIEIIHCDGFPTLIAVSGTNRPFWIESQVIEWMNK